MERLIQWLDEIDDFFAALGLIGERIRRVSILLPLVLALLLLQVGSIALALRHPPLALAAAILMFVTLLYREVTAPHQPRSPGDPAADAP